MRDLHQRDDDYIDLGKVATKIWRGRIVVLASLVFFVVVGLWRAYSLPDSYESMAVLAPRDSGELRGSNLGGQYGGLASLVGIEIGGGSELSRPALAIEIIPTLDFFKKYLFSEVAPMLMAIESVDADNGKITFDSLRYNASEKEWITGSKPSEQVTHGAFIQSLSLEKNLQTGLLTISFQHRSPDVAKEIVDLIVLNINDHMRKRDSSMAALAIDYLEKQRAANSVRSIDTVFAQMIEQQLQTLLLANVSNDYVFHIIEPPVVAETRVAPSRQLIIMLAAIFGLLFGIVLTLFVYRDTKSG